MKSTKRSSLQRRSAFQQDGHGRARGVQYQSEPNVTVRCVGGEEEKEGGRMQKQKTSAPHRDVGKSHQLQSSLAVFHCSCRTVPIWRLRCAGFWPLSVLWAQRKLDGLALVFDVLIWVLSPSLVCSLKQEAVGGGQN